MKKKTGILLGATLCGLLTFTAGVKAYDGHNTHCYGTTHTIQHHTGWSQVTGTNSQNEKALLVQARAEEKQAQAEALAAAEVQAQAEAEAAAISQTTYTNPCPYGHENCDGIHNSDTNPCAYGHENCNGIHTSETNPCPYGYDNCDGTHPHNESGMHHGNGQSMNGSGHHGGGHH